MINKCALNSEASGSRANFVMTKARWPGARCYASGSDRDNSQTPPLGLSQLTSAALRDG